MVCAIPHPFVYMGLKYSTGNADLRGLFISHTQFGSFRNCADTACPCTYIVDPYRPTGTLFVVWVVFRINKAHFRCLYKNARGSKFFCLPRIFRGFVTTLNQSVTLVFCAGQLYFWKLVIL